MANFSQMTDDAFNDYLVSAIPYILANTVRLAVSAGNAAVLAAQKIAWDTNWALYTDDDSRTVTITNTKTSQRDALETLLSNIYNDVPKSVITNQDTSVLHITAQRAPATPSPIMDHPPVMTREVRGSGLYTMHFQDPATPTSKAFPKGQAFIYLQGYSGAAGLTPDAIPFNIPYFVTRATFDLAFVQTDFGKTAYYRCYYLNNVGVLSPPSEILSFMVA